MARETPPARGRFITLEGGEGVGKSTLAAHLAAELRATGLDVLVTREPGGTPGAELLRTAVLSPPDDVEPWRPLTEALLFYAARTDHLAKLIGPQLARGGWVLCDRFSDSTRAYQAAAGGVSQETIETLERLCVGGQAPDLTFVLDLPLDLARERQNQRARAEDAIEARPSTYHEAVRQAFLAIARAEPSRCVVLDAGQSPTQVAAIAVAAIRARLGGL